MKPKILVDSISLLSPLTGIGRYTYEISKYLSKRDDFELNYFYGYYSNKLLEESGNPDLKNLKAILSKVPLLKKIIRKILLISSKLFTNKYDLYWQPNFIPVDGIKAKKTVTSVHDFSFILHREFHPKERIEYFEKYFFKNISRSDRIITGSNYSKNEILENLDFKEDKVKVIYHGINHNIFKVHKEIKIDFEIPKKFILSVGSIEPRKNLLGLLKAYSLLDDTTRSEYKLVLVGFKGWENNELMELINANKKNIHYLGFISDEELAKVYNLASCFVFASFYEGFGLPPLESMACGTPVIVSNLTSMPEVCADAAIYCDPYNIYDIKEKVELVLSDSILQNNMIEKGLKRAGEFTWEKSANEHAKVFREVLKS
ncbi:MAG: glycosyltransferase family 1 protein [Sulfurimonas sp.]